MLISVDVGENPPFYNRDTVKVKRLASCFYGDFLFLRGGAPI